MDGRQGPDHESLVSPGQALPRISPATLRSRPTRVRPGFLQRITDPSRVMYCTSCLYEPPPYRKETRRDRTDSSSPRVANEEGRCTCTNALQNDLATRALSAHPSCDALRRTTRTLDCILYSTSIRTAQIAPSVEPLCPISLTQVPSPLGASPSLSSPIRRTAPQSPDPPQTSSPSFPPPLSHP
jgi:hypothetical protein